MHGRIKLQRLSIINFDVLQLYFDIFEYLDLPSFRNCRFVSQKWKAIIMDACSPKFHLIFPFTDASCGSAKDLTEEEVGLHIYDFTGKVNDPQYRPHAEKLFSYAKTITFSGKNIERTELTKILTCALDTVKTLSFQCTTGHIISDMISPFLEMKERFTALVKLSIGYSSTYGINGPFNVFTDVLEKLGLPGNGPEFPSLQYLKLTFDGRVLTGNPSFFSINPLFQNYIAVAKLILKYSSKLTDVIIERTFGAEIFGLSQELSDQQMIEMQKCLVGFDELNLNRLAISTSATANDWHLWSELVGPQKNLKDVFLHHLNCRFDTEPVLIRMVERIPANGSLLTSVDISLTIRTSSHAPLGVDLAAFRGCANLKKLWIVIYSRKWGQTCFRNVEMLPRKIKSLHSKNVSDGNGIGIDQQILFSRQQVRWIIDNLLSLESFWTGLAFAKENEADVVILERANVDLEIFEMLLALPKIKELRLDMVKARQYAAFPGWDRRQQGNTIVSDIQKYNEVCQATPHVTATAMLINHPVPFGWTELLIQKLQKSN